LAERVARFVRASLDGGPTEPFEALVVDVARYQARVCPVSRALAAGPIRTLDDVPVVPVSLFKELDVGGVSAERAAATFRTSGTTVGRRGVVRLRSTALYDLGAIGFARAFLGDVPSTGAHLLEDPATAPDSSLSHMVAGLVPSSAWFVRGGQVDGDGLAGALSAAAGPVFVGATAFALAEWLEGPWRTPPVPPTASDEPTSTLVGAGPWLTPPPRAAARIVRAGGRAADRAPLPLSALPAVASVPPTASEEPTPTLVGAGPWRTPPPRAAARIVRAGGRAADRAPLPLSALPAVASVPPTASEEPTPTLVGAGPWRTPPPRAAARIVRAGGRAEDRAPLPLSALPAVASVPPTASEEPTSTLVGAGPTPVLPAGSCVMITGGFKGRIRAVDADELVQLAAARLGARVVLEYGMTELSSQLWAAPGRGYRAPPWLRPRVVDPETGAPLPDGVTGQLRFYDLCNLDTAVCVETLDAGRIVDGELWLEGRLPGAPARGCSLVVEDAGGALP
jgi:hypothetical protein